MGFSLPFFKKKSSQSLYFGLYLTDASAYGFVFGAATGTPQIIAYTTCSLTAGFDKILEDIDNLISELELKTNVHLDKTIFFLHSWMIDEQTLDIKEPYKGIIKNLSRDLELEPLGYIDVKEACYEHLKKLSIVNTVALEINKSKIGVFIYKGGKTVHEQYVARTDSVGEDVNAVFTSLPKSIILPPKLLVYGDVDKAEVSSELATWEWAPEVFAQHPTVDIIKQVDLNETLAQTFVHELNAEPETAPAPASAATSAQSDPTTDAVQAASPTPTDAAVDANFGFMMGADVVSEGVQKKAPAVTQSLAPEINPTPAPAAPASSILSSVRDRFSAFSFPTGGGLSSNKKPFIMAGGVIAMVITLFVLYEYFLHTLHVKVYLQSKQLDQTFDIDLPIKESEAKELAVLKHTAGTTYTEEKKATGSREIGEKATGEVIIHNFDNSERNFTRGTEIRKGDIVFTLDSDVKVASSSGVTSDGVKQSGKAKVAATAAEIGPEYNIAKGTQLRVASLSESLYVAIVESAFSGGSKEQVTTVSKADLDALQSAVEKQSEQKSEEVLGAQTSQDELLLADLTAVSVADVNFSGEVGEELSSLKIDAESEIEYYTLKKKLLVEKLQALLSEETEEGYAVDPKYITFEIDDVDADEKEATLTVDAVGKAMREVDIDQVRKAVALKSTGSLQDALKKQFSIEQIELEPSFGFGSWTPIFSKNITVSTAIEL